MFAINRVYHKIIDKYTNKHLNTIFVLNKKISRTKCENTPYPAKITVIISRPGSNHNVYFKSITKVK